MAQSVKFVVAFVSPRKLSEVFGALKHVGIQTAVLTDVRNYGQEGQTEIYRGLQFSPNFRPMIKMEIAVADDQVDQVTDAIIGAAKSAQPGEIKVFVLPAEQVTQVRKIDESVPPRAA